MKEKKPVDFFILISVIILLMFGTLMVISASAPYAYNVKGNTYYFITRQLAWAAVSIFAMLFMMKVDYKKIGKISPVLLIGTIFLLILVAIPGIGSKLNGARRWFKLGGLSFQPSELAKIVLIIFLSFSISKRKENIKGFTKGLLPYLLLVGFVGALLLLEPHMSATIIIIFVAGIILFCAGAQIKHFLFLGLPVIAGFVGLIVTSEYRFKRLISFMDPWNDPQGGGWQVVQSLYAIGTGGLFGRGFGKSIQKFLYIPEPYNDFILSILAEELGFIGVAVVMTFFIILIWRGIKVATTVEDQFGALVAAGITSLIAFEVIINIAVVTSSMPVTGMPLPFFSYGGTSLTIIMSAMGLLLNISRHAKYERI